MFGIIHATLIDGIDMIPKADASILIDNDKIIAAGTDVKVPEGVSVIDLENQFVVPGFSDAHTHLGGVEETDGPPHIGRHVSEDYLKHRMAALNWGVTAVRSAGDFMPDILEVRKSVLDGRLVSPHIVAAGRMIQAKGGHPGYTVLFGSKAVLENEIYEVDDDTEIESLVENLAEAGVDWIKFHFSEMDIFNYPAKKPRLTHEQIKRIVNAAHCAGKPVMAHVDDMEGMREVVSCGVDSVEHTINAGAFRGLEMSDALLEMLIEKNVWVVPTMIATKYHDGKAPGTSPVFDKLVQAVGKMIDAGVKIGVGCDSGIPFVPYGECVHEEMALLCMAGMTPAQALYAATAGNAKLFGMEDKFGTITPGKFADMVVLRQNPLIDIRHTKDIRMVLCKGEVVRFDKKEI